MLDGVVDEVLGEFRRAHHAAAGPPVAPHGAHNVLRVLQAIHVADFGAVVGRDRHLADLHGLVVQLDDDLGVEVEIVGHAARNRCCASACRLIGAISAVELGEVQCPAPDFPGW